MSRVLLRALRRAGSRRALSGFPSPEQDAVKSYELFKVAPRWLLLRIETANGVVGWGEPNLEGFSDTVATCVGELKRIPIPAAQSNALAALFNDLGNDTDLRLPGTNVRYVPA